MSYPSDIESRAMVDYVTFPIQIYSNNALLSNK